MFKNVYRELKAMFDFYWQLKNINVSQWDIETPRTSKETFNTQQNRR